jgi:flagellar motor switch protein FliG
MMHEDEIREVSAAMSQLGSIKADMVESLCTEFTEGMGGLGHLVGNFESTERMLQRALPRDRAAQIMEEIRGPAGRTMWDKLGNVHEAVLANYLKNEYPQTVAVVLSKVKADHAARVLTLLPDSFSIEVVMRMLRMESVQKDVLDGVERTLRAEFAALEERNRESADRIKSLMFTFDDLARLSGQAVQVLLRSVERDKLPLALKGASETLSDLFLRNLSERAGKMLREDIENLGPVKLRDVDDAQAGIVALAKELAAQGTIEIGETKNDELVY